MIDPDPSSGCHLSKKVQIIALIIMIILVSVVMITGGIMFIIFLTHVSQTTGLVLGIAFIIIGCMLLGFLLCLPKRA